MDKKELLRLIYKAYKEESTSLDISIEGIKGLPPEIGKLKNLRELYLYESELTGFPPEIEKLVNLRVLSIGSSQINKLPSEISKLEKLEKLTICYSQLTSLESEIGRLVNLRELSLFLNILTSLPAEIGKLVNLEYFDISNNQLTEIPPEIGNLKKLKLLYLYKNQLTSLPPEIEKLENLQTLRLEYNQLTNLPPEIGKLDKFKTFIVHSNPDLSSPPPEIARQGTQAITDYLRDLLEKGEEKQYRAKLIFVGEGGVGKTCTLNSLLGEIFNPQQDTTHGVKIGIGKLGIQHPAKHDVEMIMNTWDFGGQKIYHATHQFFFTKRSVYLLVWNARLDPVQCNLEKWLKAIHSSTPDSPILLVATHTDQRSPDINYNNLKEKYPQLKGNIGISNKDAEGIEKLRTAIQKEAALLPQMGEPWPVNWLDCADEIKGLRDKHHHINNKRFIDVCQRHDIQGETVWKFASMLHDLGEILYYYEDDGLNDMVILQPGLLTRAISDVLEDESTIKDSGLLVHDRFKDIWNSYDDNLRPAFLRLMEKFDLSYRIEDKPGYSIVSELVPYKPPEYDWSETNDLPEAQSELSMQYELDFVPAGLIIWFIARTHRFSSKERHWQDGVYLEQNGSRAVVELDRYSRILKLRVQGVMPHYFFSILKDSIDFILGRFKGLKVERMIPCICHRLKGVDGQCSHLFDYDKLVNRVKHNLDTDECDSTYYKVQLNEILYGIHSSTIEDVSRKVDALGHKIDSRYTQMAWLIMRNFLRLYNFELKREESECPAIITIAPKDRGVIDKVNLFSETYNVQLWCQMEGCEHPVGEPYELKQAKKYLSRLGPYLNALIGTLKFVIPIGAAVAQGIIGGPLWNATKDNFEAMTKLVPFLPQQRKVEFDHDVITRGVTSAAQGAELRVLFSLLDHLDKSHYWAGLRKTVTPEGDILWLCEKHRKEFDPGLPVF